MKNYAGFIVIIIWICMIWFFVFLDNVSYENEDADVYITDLSYKAELVDEPFQEGKVIITERITYEIDLEAYDDDIWEIWRDLPESELDGVYNSYKVNSVKEIKPDNTIVTYTESDKLYWEDNDYINVMAGYGPGKWYYSPGPYNENLRQYECVLFYVNGLSDGEITFEIEYEMTSAAFKYADCSYLYLTFFSGPDVYNLESFKAEVLIRNKDMPRKGNYEAYNYGTVDMHYPYTESTSKYPGYHTFTMELDEDDLKFDEESEFLEFEMWSFNEDKAIFSEYAPINTYSNDNVLDEIRRTQQEYYNIPIRKKKEKALTLIVCSAIGLFIAIDAYNKEKKIKSKYIFCAPSKPIYNCKEAPSDLDPYFAAKLVFCKEKNSKFSEENAYSAVLLSLVRKEYIEIAQIRELNDWSYNNVKIVIKYRPKQSVSAFNHYNMPKSNTWYPVQNNNYGNGMNNSYNVYNNYSYQPGKFANTIENSMAEEKIYEPLTLNEQYYFNLLVRHAVLNEIDMKKLQWKIENDYENTDTFVTNVENSTAKIGVANGYFQRSDYTLPKDSINGYSNFLIFASILLLTLANMFTYSSFGHIGYGGFILLGIICIASAIHLKNISHKYVLLTQVGEDEYAKWKSFYDFMNSEEFMTDRTVVELPMWEQYLVYAAAFGLSEKVANAIKLRCHNLQSSPMLSNSYYRSTHFRHSSRSFRSSVSRASSMSRSGGYGYSSGGRGGGGGGGGH